MAPENVVDKNVQGAALKTIPCINFLVFSNSDTYFDDISVIHYSCVLHFILAIFSDMDDKL